MNDSTTPTTNSRNSFRHQPFGKVLKWNKTPDGLSGTSGFAYFKLTVFEPGIIRVQASRFENFESNPYSVIVSPNPTAFQIQRL
jgi:alpha-glucosidase